MNFLTSIKKQGIYSFFWKCGISDRFYNRLAKPVLIVIALHQAKYLKYSYLNKFREYIFFSNK